MMMMMKSARGSETLKLTTDSDMTDWFLDRDVKMPAVILNDKLISDALLGNLPIKSEHSYSLNSDGDSMPDSPKSLHTKMDDMDDECYPSIPMKTATSNTRRDPSAHISLSSSLASHHSTLSSSNPMLTALPSVSTINIPISSSCNSTNAFSLSNSSGNDGTKITSAPSSSSSLTKNLRSAKQLQQHQLQMQQQIQQQLQQQQEQQQQALATSIRNDSFSTASSCSDIDIDETCIKDEPMSPESSCPPSPNSQVFTSNGSSLNMAKIAASTNSDLVFEHKNGSLQITPASKSLLKSQQYVFGNSGQNIIIPKVNIKMEPTQQNGQVFGLPPTPPSSLPSDESEGNQSPEHHLVSPMSPPAQQQINLSSSSSATGATAAATTSSSSSSSSSSSTPTSRRSTHSSHSASSSPVSHASNSSRTYSGSSTRQPIHTPLISSQPKGSTGTLMLTEEEKRTLLAEGYPIPTRLPLTKTEEKSLKKIRRKIKNKISAQESRRKKKEYMDQLERRVEVLVNENTDYKKRVDSLEDSNASLLSQLHKLQALINKQNAKKA
ncbi:cyclic AMP response element-binding protein A isoform X2 [Eupeodes corollae]|uniref:cyclic AMP response element-binding protein A isoform X2 n=1 Tax=Eupeodes corollae TaxID=290404 RepID=UPI002493A1A5|nr:cyclic AMP response element-binding protein A isoform X2 [Eupeodes corollae]XP_055905333.1 cyclic AMP response element-binding protein A isoform X2 [Eupeodes corollae]